MFYSFCSQLLVNIDLHCSLACLVALPITFFSKYGMCSLPKDSSMSTTLPNEPCFRRVRIVAKRGHSLRHGRLSVCISGGLFGRLSWNVMKIGI